MPFFENIICHLDPRLASHSINYENIKSKHPNDTAVLTEELLRFREFCDHETDIVGVETGKKNSSIFLEKLIRRIHCLILFLDANKVIIIRLHEKYKIASQTTQTITYIDEKITVLKAYLLRLNSVFSDTVQSRDILGRLQDATHIFASDDFEKFTQISTFECLLNEPALNAQVQGCLLQIGAYHCAKELALRSGQKLELQVLLDSWTILGGRFKIIDFPMSCSNRFYSIFNIDIESNVESLISWKDFENSQLVLDLIIDCAGGSFLINSHSSLFIVAIQENAVNILQKLLLNSEHFDVSARNRILFHCCRLNRAECLKLALSHFKPESSATEISPELLIYCCKNDAADCLQELLSIGLPIDYQKERTKRTPLIECIRYGSRRCGQVLMENGSSPHIQDVDGWNAFDHDIYRGFGLLSLDLGLEKGVNTFSYSHMSIVPNDILDSKNQERLIVWYSVASFEVDAFILNFSLISSPGNAIHEKQISKIDGLSGAFSIALRINSIDLTKAIDALRIQIIGRDQSNRGETSICIRHLCENDHIRTWPVAILYTDGKPSIVEMTIRCLRISIYDKYDDFSIDSNIQNDQLLIGHRGFGANIRDARIQLQENTITSFLAASKAGAEYIEFGIIVLMRLILDVQVTRDHIPILYHDFIFDDGGIECSVSSLTLKQFKGKQCICRSRKDKTILVKSEFATLEDAFKILPPDIGFNIEIKYPSPSELGNISLYIHQPIDLFCDIILDCVLKNCNGRRIFFSSFNPEICFALKMKQRSIPVFILTDGGFGRDSECMSTRDAAKFAKDLKLDGLVCESKILINSIKILHHLKSMGIRVMSYGECNNFEDSVKFQLDNGINGVIVDRLASIFPLIDGHRKGHLKQQKSDHTDQNNSGSPA